MTLICGSANISIEIDFNVEICVSVQYVTIKGRCSRNKQIKLDDGLSFLLLMLIFNHYLLVVNFDCYQIITLVIPYSVPYAHE